MIGYKVSKIITEPYGGIGNRLLTISSLYRIALSIGARLEVRWVPMPTVLEEPLSAYFNVPFSLIEHPKLTTEPGYTPKLWNNSRWYIPISQLEDHHDETMRLDASRFLHCLWMEQDLQSFGPEAQRRELALVFETGR